MEKDSGERLRELRVDGGAAANNLLLQFQADLLGVPVIRPQHHRDHRPRCRLPRRTGGRLLARRGRNWLSMWPRGAAFRARHVRRPEGSAARGMAARGGAQPRLGDCRLINPWGGTAPGSLPGVHHVCVAAVRAGGLGGRETTAPCPPASRAGIRACGPRASHIATAAQREQAQGLRLGNLVGDRQRGCRNGQQKSKQRQSTHGNLLLAKIDERPPPLPEHCSTRRKQESHRICQSADLMSV
jgi:hypothetical protein